MITVQNSAVQSSNIITLVIEQEKQKYLLTLKIEGETLFINVLEPDIIGSLCHTKKMTLEEIKKKEPKKIFSALSSCEEFVEYLKALSESKKILIEKKVNKVVINFDVEFLLKKNNIEIDLFPEKMNIEKVVDDLCKEIVNIKRQEILFKEEIKNLKNEMKKIKEKSENEIQNLKNDIKKILEEINNTKMVYNSSIMKENEFDLIKKGIEERIFKKVKTLKKLYQATINGENSATFHSKCDEIPNTITLIKLAKNRRFGGFTSESWDCSNQYKDDINSFLFSLDKLKIYPIKNNKKAIGCFKNYGPVFGNLQANDIQIGNNPKKNLYTNESDINSSFFYNRDKNALSEDGNCKYICALEYEVFQVII